MRGEWPLVVIVGPTASGKSALGMALARELGGSARGGCPPDADLPRADVPGAEVLACDSTQVYRYFDIGTGKVGARERGGIPHHLIDLLEPEELFTAGDYQRRARAVLGEVRARGRLPIVTAGTGLYLRALLEGLSQLPARSPELRARLQERAEDPARRGYLHRLLARVDPDSARAIAARDTPKLVRALEVCFSAPGGRRPRTELFAQGRERLEGYAVVKVGLMPPRAELYARIEERVERMLDAGWLEETRRLVERFPLPLCGTEASGGGPRLRRGFGGRARGKEPFGQAQGKRGGLVRAKPFEFLGYRQLAAHLGGGLSLKEAIKQIKHETRQFAKRQITWFRKEPGVRWFEGFGDDAAVQGQVADYLQEMEPRMHTDEHG